MYKRWLSWKPALLVIAGGSALAFFGNGCGSAMLQRILVGLVVP